MPHVDNKGVRIGYEVYGNGEPLVLIHGWSCEGRYWTEFGYTPTLSTELSVVVPDLRGHGASDVPENRDFSDEAFGSDVVAVLDHLGISSAHVFGYSLGGWVTFELAVNHPTRLKTAIIGGAHPYAEDLSASRNFAPAELVAYWDSLSAPLSEESKARILAFDRRALADMLADRVDKSVRLDSIGVRCLAICGTDDWRFEGMKRFASDHRQCVFSAVEHSDHLQTWFRSERVLPVVRRFLQAAAV
jgi:pimeloyl-ACP methyl ester carboxylesterase